MRVYTRRHVIIYTPEGPLATQELSQEVCSIARLIYEQVRNKKTDGDVQSDIEHALRERSYAQRRYTETIPETGRETQERCNDQNVARSLNKTTPIEENTHVHTNEVGVCQRSSCADARTYQAQPLAANILTSAPRPVELLLHG